MFIVPNRFLGIFMMILYEGIDEDLIGFMETSCVMMAGQH